MTIDQPLITAWLAARSLSRGLPMPVADSGGARVDTGAPDERARYVFAEPGEGLRALGETIDEPFFAIKLCRPAEELLALLPEHWRISSRSWVMGRDTPGSGQPPILPTTCSGEGRSVEGGVIDNRQHSGLRRSTVPLDSGVSLRGYTLAAEQSDGVTIARILAPDGSLAASGYAAELGGVFIYDRIRVEEPHQRRGLGRALMTALGTHRRDPNSREILTATAEGRALYLTMGWRDLAPYSTAMIPPA